MPKKKSDLKPSGYDDDIRNRNRIHDINRKLKRLKCKIDREALIWEKEWLIDAMQAKCPHESMAHCDAVKNTFGPDTKPMRLCTSCGCTEFGGKPYKVLKLRSDRTLVRMEHQAFAAKLGATLRWTGINI